ncbi:unnamed protein product [Moneuplotes crassus]|uniref:Uncharacterized protein n=1 Tax=Euplotes crassus TaxID=5936 RepID=A0AAD1UBF4_EUPCR|nr:unnamed protein product [Moneuplotes crassus]
MDEGWDKISRYRDTMSKLYDQETSSNLRAKRVTKTMNQIKRVLVKKKLNATYIPVDDIYVMNTAIDTVAQENLRKLLQMENDLRNDRISRDQYHQKMKQYWRCGLLDHPKNKNYELKGYYQNINDDSQEAPKAKNFKKLIERLKAMDNPPEIIQHCPTKQNIGTTSEDDSESISYTLSKITEERNMKFPNEINKDVSGKLSLVAQKKSRNCSSMPKLKTENQQKLTHLQRHKIMNEMFSTKPRAKPTALESINGSLKREQLDKYICKLYNNKMKNAISKAKSRQKKEIEASNILYKLRKNSQPKLKKKFKIGVKEPKKKKGRNQSLPEIDYASHNDIFTPSPNFRRRIVVDMENPAAPLPLGKSYTMKMQTRKNEKLYDVLGDSISYIKAQDEVQLPSKPAYSIFNLRKLSQNSMSMMTEITQSKKPESTLSKIIQDCESTLAIKCKRPKGLILDQLGKRIEVLQEINRQLDF